MGSIKENGLHAECNFESKTKIKCSELRQTRWIKDKYRIEVHEYTIV